MVCLKTLPLLEGAKLIVLDEGVDASRARTLIAGWLQTWKEKEPSRSIELLSFSDPKSLYANEPEPFSYGNLYIRDCYTLDENDAEEKDCDTLELVLRTQKSESTVIVDCLSSLIVYVGLARALRFLEELSGRVAQLICVYRRDIVQNRVPRIETLGTTYVGIEKYSGHVPSNGYSYIVKIVHRKPGGSVMHQYELVDQDNVSYEIRSEKIGSEVRRKVDNAYENQTQKIESSFRIEINASEMEQREKTALPYTIGANATNTSKIIYQPEDAYDYDEEDPDDDLDI